MIYSYSSIGLPANGEGVYGYAEKNINKYRSDDWK